MQQSGRFRGRNQKLHSYGSFTSSELILSIGRADFNRRFFDLMHREFDVAQAIVFRKAYATPTVETLMAENETCTPASSELASRYVKRYWHRDPNVAFLSCSDDRRTMLKALDHASLTGTEYWQNLFERPLLVDKMSIITSHPNCSIYVNLYRSRQRGVFDSDDCQRLMRAQDTIAAAVDKHFELIEKASDCSEQMLTRAFLSQSLRKTTKLSLREAQVCAQIVLGANADEIAKEFKVSKHSVATYRKRAFAKLQITTHKQLFSYVLARRHSLNE